MDTDAARVEPRIERSQTGVDYTQNDLKLPRSTFDGCQFVTDWYLNHLLQGNVKVCNIGTGSDTVTAKGAWVNTTPDIHMQVPDGRVVFPMALEVNIDDWSTNQDLELVLAFANSLDTTPGSGTSQTVRNMNNKFLARTGVKIESEVGAITALSGRYQEIWRTNGVFGANPAAGSNEEGGPTRFIYEARHLAPTACIVGPSELTLHVGKTTFEYFARLIFVELLTSPAL